MLNKRVGFITHNVSGTDGVSLEIIKWYNILERIGADTYFFGSDFYDFLPQDKLYVCSEAGFHSNAQSEITRVGFSTDKKPDWLEDKVVSIKDKLKSEMINFIKKFNIDILIVENVTAIPVNIPYGLAVKEVMQETGIKAVSHEHDFYWERDHYLADNCVQEYLDAAFPIKDLHNMHHVVINSKAHKHLKNRLNLDADIIYNVGDFKKSKGVSSKNLAKEIRKDALLKNDDIFFLQPVRVIKRKNIEYSIDFLNLWNKKHTNQPARLVMSHPEMDIEYFKEIRSYAEEKGVAISFIGYKVSSGKYSLEDVYNSADFVFFTSGYEGFGNALVEGVYFKKPLLVNRYEVFVDDIEPTGIEVSKIDFKVNEDVVDEVASLLNDPNEVKRIVDKNFDIFSENFSYEYLERELRRILFSL